MTSLVEINAQRLLSRIAQLGRIGALQGGGVNRLALTDTDRQGRDQVVQWMRELNLDVTIDEIGNVVGRRSGREPGPPVMTGSHIDTVATGGLYDGNLGVLAGLEIIQSLNEASIETRHPLAVAFFTNEEGARFSPDMMGSAVHQGSLPLEAALTTTDKEGASVESELARIGYLGQTPVNSLRPRAFLELHVEQGPVLEQRDVDIGAVTGVQGISWTEYQIRGTSNHAGTTPMNLRHDAGYAAAAIAVEARALASRMGGSQVATTGVISLSPNLINVIAREATMTVDLRNTDETLLCEAEAQMLQFVTKLARQEGVQIDSRVLARFAPVSFDAALVGAIEDTARKRGHSVMRLPSGAGHDAQMFAPNCPTAMVFVPSIDGVSHNVRERTEPRHIAAGAQVLADVTLKLASGG